MSVIYVQETIKYQLLCVPFAPSEVSRALITSSSETIPSVQVRQFIRLSHGERAKDTPPMFVIPVMPFRNLKYSNVDMEQ